MRTFNAKRPGELVTLAFDFSGELPDGVTVAAVLGVSCEVSRGADAGVAERLAGAPVLAGAEVLQRFDGGVLGVDYLVVPRVRLSDEQIREMPAVLPVRKVF